MSYKHVLWLCMILYSISFFEEIYGDERKASPSQEKSIKIEDELKRVQGTWKLVEYKHLEPKGVSGLDFTGRFSGKMTITDDEAVMNIKILEHELDLKPRIVLRPNLEPREWDSIHPNPFQPDKPSMSRYIYRLKDDKLTISFYPDPNSKKRPKTLDRPVKTTQTVMVWQRLDE